MDLYLHGQQEGCESTPALAENYVLHERYRLIKAVSDSSFGITYLAVHIESGALFRICECAPMRAENGIDVPKTAETKACKRRFLNAAKILLGCTIPHLPPLEEYFEENGTVYCIFPERDTIPLSQADIPRTPAYVRSLGIALCDTYAQLHRNGLFYGMLSQTEILLCGDGDFLLVPDRIFDSIADDAMDRTADMHILTAFLSGFLMLFDDEEEEQTAHPSLPILRNVLQYGYQNADLLKKALISADGGEKEPKTFQSSVKPLIRGVLCLCCLAAAAAATMYVGRNKLPLSVCMKLGLIQKDVISVWMPFREGADEKETQEMYSKLTEGFERKYAGYGVDLIIYADDSFDDALDFETHSAAPPTVFMDTQHETVQHLAADLSVLTDSLEDVYLADMKSFETALPLGCSVPALYYNAYSHEQMDVPTITYSEIGMDVPYDESASAFVEYADGDAVHTQGDFSEFLQIRDEHPILASTARLADAERNAITSGAVRMLPVSVDGSYPLQYEMYCSINNDADWNSQHIGMLWLQYLLTEEAQQIMFAEYYSALPLHSEVLPQTIENHDALSVIGDIQADFNSKVLQ